MKFEHAHRMTVGDVLAIVPDRLIALLTLLAIAWFVGDRIVEYALGVIVGGLIVYLFMLPKENG